MKKKMFMMACLAVLGIQVVKAQIAALALHHSGNVTMYNGSQFSNMMSAAVDGDTIYISSGVLSTDITISKKLTFIGAGTETIINGDISVAIPDSVTMTSRLLQDIKVSGDIAVDKSIAGLQFTRCQFNSIKFNAYVDASNIDKCVFWNHFYLSDKIKNLNIVTTKIKYYSGTCADPDNAHFINCNMGAGNGLATYINCIIKPDSYGLPEAATYKNCLFYYYMPDTAINSWNTSKALRLDGDLNATGVTLTDYLGTDGTVVGVTGTANPFTLSPSTPRVLTHSLGVNEAGTTLSVTLTVGN